MCLRLRSILSAGEWIPEFDSFIETKYLNQSCINGVSAFISPDEKLFFDYINENI